MVYRLPYIAKGQVVGLLGGSFDPPHRGHVHITREAFKFFNFDRIWWLVSPGNPLKPHGPASLERRVNASTTKMQHPRVHISDFEAQAGTRYTSETIAALQSARPHARFVWLMGADNLAQLHRWNDWQEIMCRVPVAVLARPGESVGALSAKAGQVFRAARLATKQSRLIGNKDAPSWCFVNIPMEDASSTNIREKGEWL
ncbi:nicotinate-nucleotide adenylyltransferase [Pseudopelagicola sp. nBUS_19]|uniref:nicotinate-nucleotide adenylyltransferase n=1 Tax=Pseudopelagicola sp. nBUS_19 TaxID=3395316 RepID=UPI003EB9337B